MATKQSLGVFPLRGNSDAEIRAWATFVEDLLVTTGGWVHVTCTGETAPSALVAPNATNQKKGFRVYRMDDALQSTRPVFMRLDFGSAGGNAIVGMWVTIGSSVDTATGTINGSVYYTSGATTQIGANTSSATLTNHYGSADKNRVSLAMGVATSNIGHFLFTLERSKDANGNDTTDGLYMAQTQGADGGATRRWQYINLTGAGGQPPDETGFSYTISNNSPSSFNGTVGVALAIPYAGVALQPGYNISFSKTGDFIAESQFTLTVYGRTITYQLLNASHIVTQNLTLATDSDIRWGIRFD